jgi:hypothetical protein
MATVTRNSTLPDTGVTKNEVYALVDTATVSGLVDADVSAAAAIADSKLASITTASKVNASSITGLVGNINFIIDGGGSPITTGIKGDLELPFACKLSGITMLANASCVATVDIFRDTYANYPPTAVDSIINASLASLPTVTGIKYQDTSLTGWANVSLVAGDVLRYTVIANDNATSLNVALKYSRTSGSA